ncbi:hypothetical protein CY35_04G010200 [Sphagnum magellanicum]|nr:hypothetical protein CY35_04G010200 [Sphagnum magellanicum]
MSIAITTVDGSLLHSFLPSLPGYRKQGESWPTSIRVLNVLSSARFLTCCLSTFCQLNSFKTFRNINKEGRIGHQ